MKRRVEIRRIKKPYILGKNLLNLCFVVSVVDGVGSFKSPSEGRYVGGHGATQQKVSFIDCSLSHEKPMSENV